ncbi:hypothetical protein HG437_004450 [Candidatus Saccharibacteria bacterium]|nr:hypothetical protein [Candidatus Saccharibacteria bacterium]
MTRRESDSISNGRDSSAIPPSRQTDEGQSPQSPQQATSEDWRVGQVQEGVRQPSPYAMRAMTLAALRGSIGIGSGPQGVYIFASPVARKIINGADSVSGMEQAPSVWLGDIPSAE